MQFTKNTTEATPPDCFLVWIYRNLDRACVSWRVTEQTGVGVGGGRGYREKKNRNQISRLAKHTFIYGKNVIYNGYNRKSVHTPTHTHPSTQIKMATFSDTQTHSLARRTAKCGFTQQWRLKSALPSNVGVMHTVAQLDFSIYKPLHWNDALPNPKDDMDSQQTDIKTFKCHIWSDSSLRAVRLAVSRLFDLEYL